MNRPGSKGVVVLSSGEASYFALFPDGHVERLNWLGDLLWLCACLIFRGYHVKIED